MKSILITSPGKVEIIEKPMPVLEEDEVLLKLLYGGICGSDLGAYRGTFAYFSYPQIPGHELSARIVEIRSKRKTSFKEGMNVTCNPYFNCGSCYSCTHGHVNACMDNQTMGVQREGGFSEYFKMPLERLYDGKGLPEKELALVEPFCIGKHGVARGNVQKGDKVLIIGAGTIGLVAGLSAKAQGAEVYFSDVSTDKLEFARTFGFDHVFLNASKEQFLQQVHDLTQGNGFDVSIEAVGLPETFQDCIDATCFCGKVVLIGVGKRNLDFNFTQIQKKELNIFGSRNALKQDFLETIDLFGRKEFPAEHLVSAVYPAGKAAEAFSDFSQHSGQWLKVLLDFTKGIEG